MGVVRSMPPPRRVGRPRSSSATAGAGTGMRPCAQVTVPEPRRGGVHHTRSTSSRSRAQAAPTTSRTVSTAPTSWKWTSSGEHPWTVPSATAMASSVAAARERARSLRPAVSSSSSRSRRPRCGVVPDSGVVTWSHVPESPPRHTVSAASRTSPGSTRSTTACSPSRSTRGSPRSRRAPRSMSPAMPPKGSTNSSLTAGRVRPSPGGRKGRAREPFTGPPSRGAGSHEARTREPPRRGAPGGSAQGLRVASARQHERARHLESSRRQESARLRERGAARGHVVHEPDRWLGSALPGQGPGDESTTQRPRWVGEERERPRPSIRTLGGSTARRAGDRSGGPGSDRQGSAQVGVPGRPPPTALGRSRTAPQQPACHPPAEHAGEDVGEQRGLVVPSLQPATGMQGERDEDPSSRPLVPAQPL